MRDELIVVYDDCLPDLTIARKDNYDMTILKRLQGDAAYGIYCYLVGYGELIASKEIPKKPIGDLNSVPHYRCPSCNNAIVVYEYDYRYPHCKWCGQKIDWE